MPAEMYNPVGEGWPAVPSSHSLLFHCLTQHNACSIAPKLEGCKPGYQARLFNVLLCASTEVIWCHIMHYPKAGVSKICILHLDIHAESDPHLTAFATILTAHTYHILDL